MPELKRVIAVFGGKVVMEETLGQALAVLFKLPEGAVPAAVTSASGGGQAPSAAPLTGDAAKAALDHYNKAIGKLKAGDWAGFGAELDAMKPQLEGLNKPKPAATK